MGGPSAPAIVNLTCHSQDSITIRWKRPYEFYNTIDFYVIKTRLAGQDTHRDIRINASAKELETAVSEGKEGMNRQTTVSVVKGKQLVEQFIKDFFADNFCGNCLKGGDETRLCCLWSVKRVYSVDIF